MTRSSKIVYRAPLGGHTLYASGHQPWSAQVERQLYNARGSSDLLSDRKATRGEMGRERFQVARNYPIYRYINDSLLHTSMDEYAYK